MIELARHIEHLLLDNDCVIVPGLGGFMAHSIAARYIESEQLFMPPCRQLGFNPQLRLNDSLLVQSYVEVYDMSYPEALRRIEREVEELKQHLDNEGSYYLTNIGELRVNEEGRLEFEPDATGIVTPALYGLSALKIQPVEETPVALTLSTPQGIEVEREDKIEAIARRERLGSEATGAREDKTIEEEEEQQAAALVIKLSWIRNAVAVAAAVVAFLLISTPLSNSEMPQGNDALAQTSLQKKVKTRELGSLTVPGMNTADARKQPILEERGERREERVETLEASPAPAKQQSAAEQTPAKQQPAAEPAPAKQQPAAEQAPASKPYYCIVLASQVSKKNAESYVDHLQRNGFTEAKVTSRPGMTRVVYGNYPTENAAYNELRAYRKSHFFEEAWVMKVNP